MQKSAYVYNRGAGRTSLPLRPEARVLRALAHPERLAIVECLRHGPACVCHLTAALRRPQAYVSQQLSILKTAGVITGRRDGAFIYYRLRDQGVLGIVDSAGSMTGRERSTAPAKLHRVEGCECPRCSAVPTGGVAR